jgi:FMN phosphatase YigB (HAD superfamily)
VDISTAAAWRRCLQRRPAAHGDPLKQRAVIFDLDGTLADSHHRLMPKEWWTTCTDAERTWWNARGASDIVIQPVADLFQAMGHAGYYRIILTARDQASREPTKDWLRRHHLLPEYLLLRPDSWKQQSGSRDPEMKREVYLERIQPFYDVAFVVEDRTCVVEMWRALGLTCLQNVKGDYLNMNARWIADRTIPVRHPHKTTN